MADQSYIVPGADGSVGIAAPPGNRGSVSGKAYISSVYSSAYASAGSASSSLQHGIRSTGASAYDTLPASGISTQGDGTTAGGYATVSPAGDSRITGSGYDTAPVGTIASLEASDVNKSGAGKASAAIPAVVKPVTDQELEQLYSKIDETYKHVSDANAGFLLLGRFRVR